MRIKEQYTELSIPEYALSYLINGDDSGIEPKDKKIIDDYMEQFGKNYTINIDNDESYFTWSPEFGLACTCYECTITVFED